MTERRMARRYDLSLPVKVRLPINRESGSHSGQTRDISTRGVYFTTHRELTTGTEVDFTFTLPPEITLTESIRVRCKGKVVRVDEGGNEGRVAVAAVIDEYEFLSEP